MQRRGTLTRPLRGRVEETLGVIALSVGPLDEGGAAVGLQDGLSLSTKSVSSEFEVRPWVQSFEADSGFDPGVLDCRGPSLYSAFALVMHPD